MKKLFLIIFFIPLIFPVYSANTGVEVKKTYNGKPFKYSIKLIKQNGKYDVYEVRYPSPVETPFPQNNTVITSYYRAKGSTLKNPAPTVVCVHILGGGRELTHLICAYMADKGINAAMCLLPFYGKRRPPGMSRGQMAKRKDGPELTILSFTQAIEDIRRTIDFLASRPETDKNRIGIEGVSLGAIIGCTVAARDKRIDKTALILGGGNLNKLIGHSKESKYLHDMLKRLPPEKEKKIRNEFQKFDPLFNAAPLKNKAIKGNVIMINASEDEVMPKQCTEELARVMGIKNKIQWLRGLGHYTAIAGLPSILPRLADFFSGKKIIAKPQNTGKSPLQAFTRQMLKIIELKPDKKRCFLINAMVNIKTSASKPLKGFIQAVKGNGVKFTLKARFPKIPPLEMGYGKYPWLISAQGKVFRGIIENDEKHSPAEFINPELQLYRNTATGFFRLLRGSSPEMLSNMLIIKEMEKNGRTHLTFMTKDKKTKADVELKNSNGIPLKISFRNKKTSVDIKFRHWSTDAIATPETFIETRSSNYVNVKQKQLDRMIAALINMAMEKI